MNRPVICRLTPVVLIALAVAACETVPITGRKQLAFIPDSQIRAMSIDSYRQVLKESKLSNDTRKVRAVRRVGRRLAEATEAYLSSQGLSVEGYQWEFNLIEDDSTVNAWCMPGGKVAVYTGILPVTRDDAGLATVMGHEIAHAIARHGEERLSQQLLIQLGSTALSEAMKEQPEKTRNLFQQAYGGGSQVGVLLPYSRRHESEADRIGLTLMAVAGYDPRQAVTFWERMSAAGGQRPPEFLSTHPDPERRIEDIKDHLPEALTEYAGD